MKDLKDQLENQRKLVRAFGQNNPGAIQFMMTFLNRQSGAKCFTTILNKIKDCPKIWGDGVYILWNDLCDHDYVKLEQLCTNCPNDILTDACLRQDRSGLALVEKYFTNKKEDLNV